MPPPSQLAIATSAVFRLCKEEASYHKELEKQQEQLEKTRANKDGDENAEYQLKQEETAIEETKKVFPPLRQRISDAVQKLEDQLEAGIESGAATEEEVTKARETIASAKTTLSTAL